MSTNLSIADRLDTLETDTNNFFLIVMGMIIFLMQAGFAFFEAGTIRGKNVTNILIKNYIDAGVSAISYFILGFAFAYGESYSNPVIGMGYFMLIGLPDNLYTSWFFQYVFAATSATIVSGAVAERANFLAYLVYSFLMTGIIYPVGTHWGWSSEGWLYNMEPSYLDFAGSGMVHVVGGTGALVGAILVGPRIGKFDEFGAPRAFKSSSTFLMCLGGLLLWFGFLAFNGGSQLSISGSSDIVSKVIVNTVLSGSSGAIAAFFVGRFVYPRRFQLSTCIAGNIAGLVAICAGAHQVEPYWAVVIGIIGALIDKALAELLLLFKVDDPLDAVGVHLGGGFWGLISASLFSNQTGLFYGHGFAQLGVNMLGFVSLVCLSGLLSALTFGIMKIVGVLRVSEAVELRGLDNVQHLERAFEMGTESTAGDSETSSSSS